MNIWIQIVTVVATSIVELWAAIPLGFAFGLHPVLIGTACAVGSILAAAIVIFFGKSLREWLQRRMNRGQKRGGRLTRIWEKYGVAGLGFLSPLITGAPLGAAIGIAMGAKPVKLFVWMTVGIVAWSAILTGAVAMGMLTLNG
ncbi:small multi-drug export protein [Cohnella nanjingensis]|uniref:Small multi-drug export protein n=1 Tax=Cohnella nanjingensis TaxID=1387779 RepID=A0A7X0VEE3_9BACL|nr:small multi-drug export protein [Cohnella nanjingensis]MBB6670930.1 small multi-drug export protein [Cohnella nanjingensis]